MQRRRILFILFLIYFVFAILLNSVGTVILQVINNYGVGKSAASVLEGFKDHADDLNITEVPNCGHFIIDEQPDLVIKWLSDVLAESRQS